MKEGLINQSPPISAWLDIPHAAVAPNMSPSPQSAQSRVRAQIGVLQFGTELVSAEDGTICGLLGASPGASISVQVIRPRPFSLDRYLTVRA